ncbi:hypothetical protein VVR12_01725 [Rothia sp. LK2588]|uniref:hypothetical protein n=1 Tax=Rothia sp. LK2588 TaxID=3114369 RepID=UPI0034CE9920
MKIEKATGRFKTCVSTHDFSQPRYYQQLKNAEAIRESIDRIVKELNDAGIHIAHDHNRYGNYP